MTEKFEPGDQVSPTCECHGDLVGTVGHNERSDDWVPVWLPDPATGGGELWVSSFFPRQLTLVARHADLVAEDLSGYENARMKTYLATDTIDATQEAIDRVRSAERESEPEPLADWEKALLPTQVQILNEAAELLVGQRQDDYGEPVENLAKIASLWSTAFGYGFHRRGRGAGDGPAQGDPRRELLHAGLRDRHGRLRRAVRGGGGAVMNKTLAEKWLAESPGKPCVVKAPWVDFEGRYWTASPMPTMPEMDRGFGSWREAFDWLDEWIRTQTHAQ